jgi:hypothetical protein
MHEAAFETPMKCNPSLFNYAAAGMGAKYESAQMTFPVLPPGNTSRNLSTFVHVLDQYQHQLLHAHFLMMFGPNLAIS